MSLFTPAKRVPHCGTKPCQSGHVFEVHQPWAILQAQRHLYLGPAMLMLLFRRLAAEMGLRWTIAMWTLTSAQAAAVPITCRRP